MHSSHRQTFQICHTTCLAGIPSDGISSRFRWRLAYFDAAKVVSNASPCSIFSSSLATVARSFWVSSTRDEIMASLSRVPSDIMLQIGGRDWESVFAATYRCKFRERNQLWLVGCWMLEIMVSIAQIFSQDLLYVTKRWKILTAATARFFSRQIVWYTIPYYGIVPYSHGCQDFLYLKFVSGSEDLQDRLLRRWKFLASHSEDNWQQVTFSIIWLFGIIMKTLWWPL